MVRQTKRSVGLSLGSLRWISVREKYENHGARNNSVMLKFSLTGIDNGLTECDCSGAVLLANTEQ